LTQGVNGSHITAVDKKLDPRVMMSSGDLYVHILTQQVHGRLDWRRPGVYSTGKHTTAAIDYVRPSASFCNHHEIEHVYRTNQG